MSAGRRGIIFLAGMLISAAVVAGELSHRPGVYWPHAGVVCDPSAGFCAGDGGVSPWLTGRYLGQAVRDALEDRIARGDGQDMTRFTLSNGLRCDVQVRACWRQGRSGHVQLSEAATGELFGR